MKLLYNGKIYKSDAEKGIAEAVLIDDGKFVCVGSLDECKAMVSDAEMIDLQGKTVIPGLIDGHVHPNAIARSQWFTLFPMVDNITEFLENVRAYCEEHPASENPYLYGIAYDPTWFDEKGPNKELLDSYVSDRPVRLQDFTDHGCWYNSKAMELLDIDNNPYIIDGTPPFFVRDEKGELTGWAKEAVMNEKFERVMYEKIGWYPPESATEETVTPFLDFLKGYGVIGLFDGFTDNEATMKLYHDMDKAGKLNMFYEGAVLVDNYEELEDGIANLRSWQKYETDHVKIHTIKIFADNTNEMGNSASLEVYKNDPTGTNYGSMNFTEDEITKILLRLNEEGLDIHVHVVCDRAFRTCCDAYEKAKAQVSAEGKEWTLYMELAHCELVHPDDMKRPGELGIFLNWSCHWGGGYFGDAGIEYLGKDRWNTMYDFTKMIEAGAVVTYGSDVVSKSEAHRGNPYFGMQITATRVDPEVPLDPELYPGSIRQPESAKLSVEEMIKGYTRFGAMALRLEDRIGSIEVGKLANLAVLNKDIFAVPAEEIGTVEADMVMFEGEFIKR